MTASSFRETNCQSDSNSSYDRNICLESAVNKIDSIVWDSHINKDLPIEKASRFFKDKATSKGSRET